MVSKFGRDQEREADEIGIREMHTGGYDAGAASRFWIAMMQSGARGSASWWASHPAEHIDVWRVLHSHRDIPTWMRADTDFPG